MSLKQWSKSLLGLVARRGRKRWPRQRRLRLALEQLGERCLPSNSTAASMSPLLIDFDAAHQTGETMILPTDSAHTVTSPASQHANKGVGGGGIPIGGGGL